MAVPKKKSSRSRRNMRRFSAAYELDTVTKSTDPVSSAIVRAHTVSLKTIREGLYQPRQKKPKTSATKTA
jgi:ribosomal protein L32